VFEMSEMKPVARVDGRWSDGKAMVRTLAAGTNMPLGTELYTAAQLAEAVAAEKERCAKVCEKQRDDYADPAYAGGPIGALLERIACQTCAGIIRSAAK